MLIGLHGLPSAGKDSTAKILVNTYGWRRVAFADPVRAAVYRLNPWIKGAQSQLRPLVQAHGWDKLKRSVPEVRDLLDRMGTEVGRQMFGETVWVDMAFRRISPDDNVVITDVRAENEADRIHEHGGLVVNVIRPGCVAPSSHEIHRVLPAHCIDYTLHNDDFDALGSRVAHLLWWAEHREA
jgi:hypothetical protein